MSIPLRAGRYFTEQDTYRPPTGPLPSDLDEEGRYFFARNAIIIDEEFARRHWPNEDAVGNRVRLGGSDPNAPLVTVVGVVGRSEERRVGTECRARG